MDAQTCAGWLHALEQPQAGPALGHQPWSKVHLHYTPTYSFWLNQVENWFARIERDVITRGVFTSVKDLVRKLMRYIRHYNRAPKPIKWTYRDPSRRISPDTNVTVTGHSIIVPIVPVLTGRSRRITEPAKGKEPAI
jgi:hypothetical protein